MRLAALVNEERGWTPFFEALCTSKALRAKQNLLFLDMLGEHVGKTCFQTSEGVNCILSLKMKSVFFEASLSVQVHYA